MLFQKDFGNIPKTDFEALSIRRIRIVYWNKFSSLRLNPLGSPMNRMKKSINILTLTALIGLFSFASGCQQPILIDSLTGRPHVYPDIMKGHPTLVAFLSANDRRCDDAIKPLISFHYRGTGSPVKVVGVMVYDKFSYLKDVQDLNKVAFTMLLDPDRRLAEKYGIVQYPTYLYLNVDGEEIERVHDIRLTQAWVDSPSYHEKAFGMRPGTFRQVQNINPNHTNYPPGPLDRPGYNDP